MVRKIASTKGKKEMRVRQMERILQNNSYRNVTRLTILQITNSSHAKPYLSLQVIKALRTIILKDLWRIELPNYPQRRTPTTIYRSHVVKKVMLLSTMHANSQIKKTTMRLLSPQNLTM